MNQPLTLRQQDEINALLDKHVASYELKNQVCYRIKWRGKFIKTASGKKYWGRLSSAKNAWGQHLKRCYTVATEYYRIKHDVPPQKQIPWFDAQKEFVADFRNSPEVEFVQVTLED